MNNIIKRAWNQNRLVNIEDLTGMVFQAEADGHTFEISGVDDEGNAVALSGSVAGVFRRPDNADIALTGSAYDGVVYVTLSEDCYAVPGRFGLTIFVTSNSQKVAVYACVGTVAVSSTGNVAGDTPASVEDLIDDINAAIADLNSAIGQIPASYANVMAAIAPTYSGSALYSVGSYAWYNGSLYRCATAITTAETWTAAHWTAAVLGDDVGDLKSALASVDNELSALYVIGKNLIDPNKISSNTILYSDGATATASGYNTCDFIPIKSGQSITFSRIRKFIAYDTDKAVVSGSWYSEAYENYTYTATEDGYVRASVADAYLSTWQAEYGTSATPYEAYQRFLAIELGETPLGQVADLIAEAGAIYLMEDITPASGYTDNVFIRWDTGGTSGNSAYRATPQINIRQYTHILYTRIQLASASAQSSMGMAFASKSAYISGQVRLSGSELKYIPTLIKIPEGAVSARFTEHKSLTGFSIKGVRKIDVKDIAQNSNILLGKKWAVCGDSFTNGALSTTIGEGKYSNEKVVYPYLIGNRNEMQIIKFFEGGRTLAFPAQPGTFENSLTNPNADWFYQNIPADADYITIYLGINDEHHAPGSSGGDGEDNTGKIPIGTIDDATTATYLGAWNVVLTWLITNRPNAHIGIIVTNGIAGKDEYRQGQIAIAQKYGIPYIDMNGDSRTPAMLRTSNPNIPAAIKQALINKWAVDPATNTHPNDAAQLFESYFIENFLRSI